MDPRHYRPPSPGTRRMNNPMRSSTGNMNYDPYSNYYDSYHATPRSSQMIAPTRSSGPRVEEIGPPQIVRSRDPPSLSTQHAGDYLVRPRRSTMESSTERSRRPLSLMPPTEIDRSRHVVHGGRGLERPSSPLAQSMTADYGSNYYLQPYSTQSPRRHQRYPSAEHDPRYLRESLRDPRDRPGYRRDARAGAPLAPQIRSPDYDESYGYSYTDPREQFYRDVASRPQLRPRRGSIDAPQQRPMSMTELGDYLPRIPKEREIGPPPSTRGWGKIDRSSSFNRGQRPVDYVSDRDYASARVQGSMDQLPHRTTRRPISVHQQGYDEGYGPYRDDYDDSRERRPRHKPNYDSDTQYRGRSDSIDRYVSSDDRPLADRPKVRDSVEADSPRKEHHRRHRKEDRDKDESDSDRNQHRRRHTSDKDHDNYKSRDKGTRLDEIDAEESNREHRSRRHRDRSSDDRELRGKDEKRESVGGRRDGEEWSEQGERRRRDRRVEEPASKEVEENEEMRERERRRKERRDRRERDEQEVDEGQETQSGKFASQNPRDRDDYERRPRRDVSEDPSRDLSRAARDRDMHSERINREALYRNGEQMYSKPEDHRDDHHRDRDRDPYSSHGSSAIDIVPPPPKESQRPVKGILRPPTEKFPEDPAPVREGVAPHKDSQKAKGIPPGARWTKIDRKLVNPAALEEGNERFEERMDYVIVLRVLTKEEIQEYAKKTQAIRDARYEADRRNSHRSSRRAIEPARDPELPSAVEARALDGAQNTESPPLPAMAPDTRRTGSGSAVAPQPVPSAPEMERIGSKERERERDKDKRGSKDYYMSGGLGQ